MNRITHAVTAGREGDPASAHAELLALWEEIGVKGDPFHRCTLAHYLADVCSHPAEALMWDVRALDAAEELTDSRAQAYEASLQVAAFYPSLRLNIADNLRQLSAFSLAKDHIDAAREASSSLRSDPYGKFIIDAIESVARDIENEVTSRRSSSP